LDIDALKEAQQTKRGVGHIVVAKMIIDKPKMSLKEIAKKAPGYLIANQRKVIDFQKLVLSWEHQEFAKFYGVEVPFPSINEKWKTDIAQWINTNFDTQRRHKQKQLYLWGPPNIGKTSLVMELLKYFKGYQIPTETSFYNGFDDSYEFAWIDEFAGHKELHFMNSFLEGAPMQLNIKGMDPVTKTKNIPVIILSNIPPEQAYHNIFENPKTKMRGEAFKERILEVNAVSDIRVVFKGKPPSPRVPVIDLSEGTELTVPIEEDVDDGSVYEEEIEVPQQQEELEGQEEEEENSDSDYTIWQAQEQLRQLIEKRASKEKPPKKRKRNSTPDLK